MNTREQYLSEFIRLRGVWNKCECCHGFGARLYSTTATWRGGIGGQAFTYDVCDHCWGSGDEDNRWEDLRELRDERRKKQAAASFDFISNRCGLTLGMLEEEANNVLTVLDREANKRNTSRMLKILRDAIRETVAAAKEQREKMKND